MEQLAYKLKLTLAQRWFSFLVSISIALVVITFFSYALQSTGSLSSYILFKIGLGGENNIGAWWSGMLLLLGGVMAFDGYSLQSATADERAGWLMLCAILVGMSLDEIGSVHEQMNWILYGASGLALLSFAVTKLVLGGADRRLIGLTLTSFALLGTIAVQEYFQHSLTWDNKTIYGLRAMVEEGTEIAAMLMLIRVTSTRTGALLGSDPPDMLALGLRLRTPLTYAGIILAPALAAATFILPFPPGPAGWLSATFYLLCSLAVVRGIVMRERSGALELALFAMYVSASVMSCAVSYLWDISLFGILFSVLALTLCALILILSVLLQKAGRHAKWIWLRASAIGVLAIAWWSPDDSTASQFVWCLMPSIFALWFYAIESRFQCETTVADLRLAKK